MQQRLRNLGYPCGSDEEGTLGAGTRLAVTRCYTDRGLTPPAAIDDSTVAGIGAQIETLHGS